MRFRIRIVDGDYRAELEKKHWLFGTRWQSVWWNIDPMGSDWPISYRSVEEAEQDIDKFVKRKLTNNNIVKYIEK